MFLTEIHAKYGSRLAINKIKLTFCLMTSSLHSLTCTLKTVATIKNNKNCSHFFSFDTLTDLKPMNCKSIWSE